MWHEALLPEGESLTSDVAPMDVGDDLDWIEAEVRTLTHAHSMRTHVVRAARAAADCRAVSSNQR